MKFVAIFFVLLMTASAHAEGPCDYYSMKARALGCSKDNYLTKFGERYCRIFERRQPSFSDRAQAILTRIRGCLILAMEERHPTCETSEAIGLGTHYGCYIQSGYCNLSGSDRLHIFWVMRGQALNPRIRRVGAQLEETCRARGLY